MGTLRAVRFFPCHAFSLATYVTPPPACPFLGTPPWDAHIPRVHFLSVYFFSVYTRSTSVEFRKAHHAFQFLEAATPSFPFRTKIEKIPPALVGPVLAYSTTAGGFSYIVSRFYNVPGTFPVGRRSTTFFFPGEFSERSQPTWMDVGVLGCWGRGTYILAGTPNGCVRPYYREYT